MDNHQFKEIAIFNFAAWMDGGSVTFNCVTKDGKSFGIEITQHVIFKIPKGVEGIMKLPGRIYMNNSLVPVRSELEMKLISELKEVVNRKGGLGSMDKACLVHHLNYIDSEQYVINSINHSE